MSKTREAPSARLPALAWLALPLTLAGGLALLRVLLPATTFERYIMGEQGFVELATVVLLLPAIVSGAVIVIRRQGLPARWLLPWFGAFAAACLYFAGEEASWGQHLVGWKTPEAVARLNDQQETNLHNMSSWLDQKPRLLLELWILVGGVIVGTRRALARDTTDWGQSSAWIWPSGRVALAAWLAIAVRLPERIAGWTDAELTGLLAVRLSEFQELFFALVLLLYLWDSARRARSRA